jgi:hypothetical protein
MGLALRSEMQITRRDVFVCGLGVPLTVISMLVGLAFGNAFSQSRGQDAALYAALCVMCVFSVLSYVYCILRRRDSSARMLWVLMGIGGLLASPGIMLIGAFTSNPP